MIYGKPEVTAMSAAEAIQSESDKMNHFYPDNNGSNDPAQRQTTAAYEADE